MTRSDEMSCKYCEKEKNERYNLDILNKDFGQNYILALIEKDGLYIEDYYDDAKVEINYCPMCGRKLVEDNIPYKEVVDYLNGKTGRNFKHTTKSTQTCIRARFNDGFELDDFKKVVDKKSKDWLGSKYEKYLRPETLFKSKFDSYLQDAKASENEVDWEDLL